MTVIFSHNTRRILSWLLPFVIMPGLVCLGALFARERGYWFVAVTMVLIALLLYHCGFDQKRVGSRRLVLVSLMTALAVLGRFLPVIKPVSALVVLTGVYFGSQAGFLSGALCAFVSNIFFGQGPWTPFQMLALGLVGFFAGAFCKLLTGRWQVTLYGALSGFLYSLIMDVWTVFWATDSLAPGAYFLALFTSLPHTLIYCVSNALFLWLFYPGFRAKLSRVKIVYGI